MRIINRQLGRYEKVALGTIPFVLLIGVYTVASHFRRLDNPADKLLPSLEAMGNAFGEQHRIDPIGRKLQSGASAVGWPGAQIEQNIRHTA